MALLNWGNVLVFTNEHEYYETLGFLCKETENIRVYIESNQKAGAWAEQGRMTLRIGAMDDIPIPLKDAFQSSRDGRVSETKYVRNLRENHCFTKEVDPTGSDFTKRLYKTSLEDVENTVPAEYKKDFYRGYHWNCEIVSRIRVFKEEDEHFTNETKQEVTVLDVNVDGQREGKKSGYYVTKYERNPKNRKEAIRIHGTKCMVCGFDYNAVYGALGKDYIEVHHVKPLATFDEETIVNPQTDLICVCANCHRMLHRFRNYIVSVEELKDIVEDNTK